jgi:hypothetical protein
MTMTVPYPWIQESTPPSNLANSVMLFDASGFSDVRQAEQLPARVCEPMNWGRYSQTGLPRILELSRCHADELQWLESIVAEQNALSQSMPLAHVGFCAWLDTDQDASNTAGHLRYLLKVLPVDRAHGLQGTPTFWRFYDPRVFPHVCRLLSADQLASLMGPIRRWRFQWLGHWYECQRDALAESTFPAPFSKAEWDNTLNEISLVLWTELERGPQINQILMRLALPESVLSRQLLALADQAQKALAIADQSYWLAGEDAIHYGFYAVRYGQAFTSLPQLTRLPDRSVWDQTRYSFDRLLDAVPAKQREQLEQMPAQYLVDLHVPHQ